MSILSNIFDRLRNRGKPAEAAQAPAATQAPAAPAATTTVAAAPQAAPQQPAAVQAPAQPAKLNDVDMERVLEDLAAKNPQKLNWRTSIVDLMKLLGMDSSLQQRKELADELGYQGDKGDSAAMNIWLHKQVLRKVAGNGGKVPAALLD
jgi:3-oxoacyl-ACP reductase-like protein